jgi:hypothetical protein
MTLLEEIVQRHTNEAIYSVISVTIETIAAEAAREMLKDPTFRADLKALARQSFGRALRDLHRNGGRRPRARKPKAAKK